MIVESGTTIKRASQPASTPVGAVLNWNVAASAHHDAGIARCHTEYGEGQAVPTAVCIGCSGRSSEIANVRFERNLVSKSAADGLFMGVLVT